MATTITPQRASRAARARGLVVKIVLGLGVLALLAFVIPSLFGVQRFVVTGVSMTGTYDRGSVLFEQTVPASDIQVGDVITYQPPAESGLSDLVTHRVISIEGNEVRTQGDANPQRDPWTVNLHGDTHRVVAGVPFVGHLFIALGDAATRWALTVLPVLVVGLLVLSDSIKDRRTRRDSRAIVATESVSVPAPRLALDSDATDRERVLVGAGA